MYLKKRPFYTGFDSACVFHAATICWIPIGIHVDTKDDRRNRRREAPVEEGPVVLR